jgi:RNA polymerase sigma factor (sigma-70 family)
MHFRIQIVVVTEDGTEHFQEIADLMRSEAKIETMGLTLEESKQVLHNLQQTIIEHQVTAYLEQERPCPQCQKQRQRKDCDTSPFRTLFGTIQVSNPRWHHCACQEQEKNSFRPLTALLRERTSPELLYLETKWASIASYGLTSKLLHEVLPIDQKHSEATIRNHMLRTAQRQEQTLGDEKVMFLEDSQADRDRLPIPDGPLSIGIDGGIVRACRGKSGEKTPNLFEVIAGKSILSFRRDDPEDAPPSSKCFALVQSFDEKPKRRLFDLLQSQGMQANAIVDHYRSQKPWEELPVDIAAPESKRDYVAELATCLQPLIAEMPETYRTALVLSEIEGLPQREVADRLNISLSGAKSRVQRGREKLRQHLLDCCEIETGRAGITGYEPRGKKLQM